MLCVCSSSEKNAYINFLSQDGVDRHFSEIISRRASSSGCRIKKHIFKVNHLSVRLNAVCIGFHQLIDVKMLLSLYNILYLARKIVRGIETKDIRVHSFIGTTLRS